MKTRFSQNALSCGICYNPIEIRGKLDSCDHEFCATCIERWAQTQNTCPICIKRFYSLKKMYQRVVYSTTKVSQTEVKIVNKDQNKTYMTLAEYLLRYGFVQGREFVLIRYV